MAVRVNSQTSGISPLKNTNLDVPAIMQCGASAMINEFTKENKANIVDSIFIQVVTKSENSTKENPSEQIDTYCVINDNMSEQAEIVDDEIDGMVGKLIKWYKKYWEKKSKKKSKEEKQIRK